MTQSGLGSETAEDQKIEKVWLDLEVIQYGYRQSSSDRVGCGWICYTPALVAAMVATFTRRGAVSEVHSEADISHIADPATLVSTRPRWLRQFDDAATTGFSTRVQHLGQCRLDSGIDFSLPTNSPSMRSSRYCR
jgi:hypothetical protein